MIGINQSYGGYSGPGGGVGPTRGSMPGVQTGGMQMTPQQQQQQMMMQQQQQNLGPRGPMRFNPNQPSGYN